MNSQPSSTEKLFLLNRDHIISVSESASELTVLTTAGKLIVTGNAAEIAQLRDELANDVRSNFVSVPPPLRTIQPATKVLPLLVLVIAIATGVSAGDLEYNLKPWVTKTRERFRGNIIAVTVSTNLSTGDCSFSSSPMWNGTT